MTVLLGSRFAPLAGHGTRWRAVLTRWARDPRISDLTVVDYPRFHLAPSRCIAQTSWLEGVRSLHVTVPAPKRPSVWDGLAWKMAADRLRQQQRSASDDVVTVATTPLWVPLLKRLGGGRLCFDGVDDWREYPAALPVRARVEKGYASVASCDVSTAVSHELARRLSADYGVRPHVVGNGVDMHAYATPAEPPPGLPEEPFAVYAGVVEGRVDLELLRAAATMLPVVVAGPAEGAAADALRAAPLLWLGPIDVKHVPGLLQRATVGLLPHYVDRFTASMCPMKLLEYLAAGLPVVATPVAGLIPSARVQVAHEPAAFAAEVARAMRAERLPGPDPAVADRDWDRVADSLLRLYAGPCT